MLKCDKIRGVTIKADCYVSLKPINSLKYLMKTAVSAYAEI